MIKMYLTLLFVTASLLFSTPGQGSERARMNNDDRLVAGVWGGQHIRMEVTDDGAQIEFDCAHSTMDEPVVLDHHGRFEVKGKFTREHGGPVRSERAPNSSPVRYIGQVEGQTMTLTIRHDETGESFGDYTLTQGSQGRLMKCM